MVLVSPDRRRRVSGDDRAGRDPVGSAWLTVGVVVLWALLTWSALEWVWQAAGWSFWWSPAASPQQVEEFRSRAWVVGLISVGLPVGGAALARVRGCRNAAVVGVGVAVVGLMVVGSLVQAPAYPSSAGQRAEAPIPLRTS